MVIAAATGFFFIVLPPCLQMKMDRCFSQVGKLGREKWTEDVG